MIHLWWFFRHVIGIDNASGSWYLLWSGIFGDVVIFGAAIGLYKKHNCHEPTCWRIGKHTVDGSPYCSKHHMKARKHAAIH